MSQTPPPGYRMSEIWLHKVDCPECGHPFDETLRALKGKSAIPCPNCETLVDLAAHTAEIGDKLRQAAEIDKEGPKPD